MKDISWKVTKTKLRKVTEFYRHFYGEGEGWKVLAPHHTNIKISRLCGATEYLRSLWTTVSSLNFLILSRDCQQYRWLFSFWSLSKLGIKENKKYPERLDRIGRETDDLEDWGQSCIGVQISLKMFTSVDVHLFPWFNFLFSLLNSDYPT